MISSLLGSAEVAEQKNIFSIYVASWGGEKKCKTPDSSPCSCERVVVLFSGTMFH